MVLGVQVLAFHKETVRKAVTKKKRAAFPEEELPGRSLLNEYPSGHKTACIKVVPIMHFFRE